MASSDNFRKQLKAGNITEALALALSEAVELNITTWVASSSDEVEAEQAQPGHRLRTRINLIEGDIENEIGDQFIANGPYRELRQFHLEQVAEGHRIIQSNLKTVQKLFEVLLATRSSAATPPVIEPEYPDVESQLLPPVEEGVSTDFVVEPHEFIEEAPVVTPGTGIEDWTSAELVIEPPPPVVEEPGISSEIAVEELIGTEEIVEPQELVVEESVVSPPPVIQEDVIPEPPQALEDLQDAQAIAPPSSETLELEPDEDVWDDSVLELLESIPVEPPPPPEASDLEQLDEDWGWIDSDEQEQELETSDTQADEEWGILTLDDLDDSPISSEQNIQPSNPDMDEDWGDLIEPKAEQDLEQSVPSLESLDLDENEEWDDWVVEEPQPSPRTPTAEIESLNLGEDEDWSDFEQASDPFATTPAVDNSVSELDLNEEWDDFSVDESEPFSDFLDEDSGFSSSNTQGQENRDLNSNLDADVSVEADLLDEFLGDDFEDIEEPEAGDLNQDSEPPAVSEDNGEANKTSTEKRVPPPPPPPSRFPNRNP
ncbi:MAG TPA: hypothetical protein V6C95_03635 [Coleofasciculaceae cyanobacterium]